MSNEQAPECCPFCGAGIYILKNGKPCSDPEGSWSEFACGNQWHRGSENQRSLQTQACAEAERERLTRERDEARKLDVQATQHCVDVMNERDQLLARMKRLEEALKFGVGEKRAKELMGGSHIGSSTEIVRHTKEIACPECYGGHFKPCIICGDSGVALIRVEAKEATP